MKWNKMIDVHGGHRYFQFMEDGPNRGRIGIADRSGTFPDTTECGLFWLDRDRAIIVPGAKEEESSHVISCSIPIKDPGGREFTSPACFEEAFIVSETFGMKLKMGNRFFGILEEK